MTDWTNWTPTERATLCFIIEGGRILLIRKRRGLGAGKINAPGGKIDPGETARAAAIRETIEEVCVEPLEVELRGELFFQFTDGYGLHCVVYRASGCLGEPQETPEALPIWTPLDAIPYDDMWSDDREWLPHLLAGNCFRGWFEFESDRMLSRRVEVLPADHYDVENTPCPAS